MSAGQTKLNALVTTVADKPDYCLVQCVLQVSIY
jgi:hypothetical protein